MHQSRGVTKIEIEFYEVLATIQMRDECSGFARTQEIKMLQLFRLQMKKF